MIKRFARWILNNESFTQEHAQAIDERFCNVESEIYSHQSLINRNHSDFRKLREDMKILQTRQVNILIQIRSFTDE